MSKVNGTGNGDNKDFYAQMQAYLDALRAKATSNTEKIDDTVTLTPPPANKKVTEKELLSADYRSYFGAKFTTDPIEARRNADLEAIPQTTLAGITPADRKEAFHLVDNPLVQAYMYGPMSESTFAAFSKLDGTTFPPEMTADLLADVEINAA